MDELTNRIATAEPGRYDIAIEDRGSYVVYYDERPAIGDNGLPVPGDVVGEYSLYAQTGSDPLLDLEHIACYHVAPHGDSGYGNDHARLYAAEQIIKAIKQKKCAA